MRLALIADWLTTYGGAEHVLEEFTELFPHSPLFTTVARHGNLGPLDKTDIRTTRLQMLYKLTRQHQILLPLMPRALEELDLDGFDVILSSSHAVGKGIIPPSTAVHICYCHTPMRYAWEMENEYLEDFRVPKWLRPRVKRELTRLRRWDLTTAKRVDMFIANSTTTQERIERIYGRTSIVVPPPVNQRFLEKYEGQRTKDKGGNGSYFLALGRLVPYKRFDLLIEAANALKIPLKIAGSGQDEKRLKQMAGPTVEFLGRVPDEDLPALYSGADALLFPQFEDAGIVPLEAQASGTPVLAFDAGGAKDAIKNGKTGLFFEKQTLESVADAIKRSKDITWDRDAIRDHARGFSQKKFREEVMAIVKKEVEKRSTKDKVQRTK